MTVKSYATHLTNYLNSGSLEVTAVTMNATTISPAAAGTVDASSMVVVDANKDITGFRHVTLTGTLDAGDLAVDGVTIGSTPAEIDQICDASLQTETRTGAGAISITKLYTSLVTTGADALTLAAPGAASIPRVKVIHMTTDGGDGTLASTNIIGQSSGTTSITFNDAGDYLILQSVPGLNKWAVIKEGGVTAA